MKCPIVDDEVCKGYLEPCKDTCFGILETLYVHYIKTPYSLFLVNMKDAMWTVIKKVELMLCNTAKRPGAKSCTTFRTQVQEFRTSAADD